MATDNWFRNITWDSAIEADFEARLKRSRGAFYKAQYLRIQAGILLDNSDKYIQLVGLRLMERLIKDFAAEESSTIFGHEQLGDYYLRNNNHYKAEEYFRIVTEHCKSRKSRSGTSGISDLKLAETILALDKSEKFEEAYNLCKEYPTDELTFNSDVFYYNAVFAQVCKKLNKIDEAKEYANAALKISKVSEPQFSRHKTVGLVRPTSEQIQILKGIANN
jgi:tetratricopeptide (TPR) repeat protein